MTHLDPERLATAPSDLTRAREEDGSTRMPSIAEQIWQLASDATNLSAQAGLPTEVMEATAALQDLACQVAEGPTGEAETIARLKALQTHLPVGIRAQVNGPYLVTNVETLRNWLGQRLPLRPQTALCRCGGSTIKPFCDGTHAATHFTDGKDPQRVPDGRDTYIGQQVTVLDNRGTCAHSGFCTDRVPTVFRQGQEPFVAPSGARLDDIVRAIRACPSGALSSEIDQHEARIVVDSERAASIEVSKDGQYRVTGGVALFDEDWAPATRNLGASREQRVHGLTLRARRGGHLRRHGMQNLARLYGVRPHRDNPRLGPRELRAGNHLESARDLLRRLCARDTLADGFERGHGFD